MGFAQSGESMCPVAQTLFIVGERWTMLILRELFLGSKRFDEFLMYTDMSPHLLSTRLKGLVTDGIINRSQYQDRPPRYEYSLTPMGMDLFPVLISLKAFGDKHAKYRTQSKTALTMVHTGCGHATDLHMLCSSCNEPFSPMDAKPLLSPEFLAEREERKAAFIARP